VKVGTVAVFAACLLLTGCQSRWVEATIVNQGPAVKLVEFDYPSASFGANQLAAGAKYTYRFKVQGSGQLTLAYVDTAGKTHTFQGPKVDQGDQGSLVVSIQPADMVSWKTALTNPK
jgi:hypothetical protein